MHAWFRKKLAALFSHAESRLQNMCVCVRVWMREYVNYISFRRIYVRAKARNISRNALQIVKRTLINCVYYCKQFVMYNILYRLI